MGRMHERVTRRAAVAIAASTATAALGVATALIMRAVRHMSVGSVGGDRDRYDVYYDLMRQAQPGTHEA